MRRDKEEQKRIEDEERRREEGRKRQKDEIAAQRKQEEESRRQEELEQRRESMRQEATAQQSKAQEKAKLANLKAGFGITAAPAYSTQAIFGQFMQQQQAAVQAAEREREQEEDRKRTLELEKKRAEAELIQQQVEHERLQAVQAAAREREQEEGRKRILELEQQRVEAERLQQQIDYERQQAEESARREKEQANAMLERQSAHPTQADDIEVFEDPSPALDVNDGGDGSATEASATEASTSPSREPSPDPLFAAADKASASGPRGAVPSEPPPGSFTDSSAVLGQANISSLPGLVQVDAAGFGFAAPGAPLCLPPNTQAQDYAQQLYSPVSLARTPFPLSSPFGSPEARLAPPPPPPPPV